jgi:cyanate permease
LHAPTVWFLLPEPPAAADRPASQARTQSVTAREIWQNRPFWQIALALFLATMALGGHGVTLAPLLKTRGIPMEGAAMSLLALGLTQIVGRLLSGRLLDVMPTAAIGSIWMLSGAAGIAVVNIAHTLPLAMLGGALLGAGVGAELEMGAYFTTRFFRLGAFGRVFGLLLSVFIAGGALGPLVMGLGHDIFGSYTVASLTLMGALLVAAALILTLGPYRFPLQQHGAQN